MEYHFDGRYQIYLTPIHNLEISEDLGGEIVIDKVHFISKEKINNFLNQTNWTEKIIESLKTRLSEDNCFALYIYTDENNTKTLEAEQYVQSKIDLLAFSMLNFLSNPKKYAFGLSDPFTKRKQVLIHTKDYYFQANDSIIKGLIPFKLDQNWKNFQDKFSFTILLKLINGDVENVDSKWIDTLKGAATLIGSSVNNHKLQEAFLLNMIVLEMLLLKENERNKSTKIKERLEALFGWTKQWKELNLETNIQKLYNKRNDVVHEGKFYLINEEDLILILSLNFNIFLNITHFNEHFNSIEALIKFTERYNALKFLGSDLTLTPNNLKFAEMHTKYITTVEELNEIL